MEGIVRKECLCACQLKNQLNAETHISRAIFIVMFNRNSFLYGTLIFRSTAHKESEKCIAKKNATRTAQMRKI